MQVPQVPDSSQIRFRCRLRTRWSDEDCQGVLNNAVALTLLEEARFVWAKALGLLDDDHFPFLVAQTNVRFIAPGRGSVEVEVELSTTHLGKSSFEQAYRLREVASGKVWVEAQARLVVHDPQTGKSCPMTPQFRAAIAASESLI